MDNIIEALNYIDVKSLDYGGWIRIGQALKAEGYPCSVWDEWSSPDSRYISGECGRKWATFKGDEVKGGTIVYMAKERGYTPSHRWADDGRIGWDGVIEYDGYDTGRSGVSMAKEQTLETKEEPQTNEPLQEEPQRPEDDVIRFLSALYEPDENVNIVLAAKSLKEKYVPTGYGINRKAGDLISDLKTESLKEVFPGLKDAPGAWIRANPTDAKGISDSNVTAYRYALIESDNMPLDAQKRLIQALNFPVATLVYSGGKSLHALVKVDAKNEPEYKTRVSFLHKYCKEHGLDVDTQNKNPSRLTRLPGVMRGDQRQALLAVNIGDKTWDKWAAQVAQEEANRGWEEPIPLDEYNLPVFPVDALPAAIGDYCKALAESTQTPVDMACVCALAVVAVAMQGKYTVRVNPDWKEPVNIFVACIMRPSERKSAIQAAMCEPLNDYEREWNLANATAIEYSHSKKRILENRQRNIEKEAANGKKSSTDVESMAEEIAAFKEIVPLRLYADDITPEALSGVLSAQGGSAAILSSEGGIFDILSGAYSKNVNLDVFLKSYSGDSIRVDRIGRSSEFISSPALTISLMLQPQVLERVISDPTFKGRGLTARFLYSIPRSAVGSRKYKVKPVDADIKETYWEEILDILGDDTECTIKLTPEADELLEGFSTEIEGKLLTEYEPLEGWAGKLIGNTARISGLLWRSGITSDNPFKGDSEVDGKIMADAIRIGRYFLAHALAAFGMGSGLQDAKRALSAVKGQREFTKRDVLRKCRALKTAEDVQKALDVLEAYGYVRPKSSTQTQGRPSAVYEVNPRIKR